MLFSASKRDASDACARCSNGADTALRVAAEAPQPDASPVLVDVNDDTMSPTTPDMNRDLYGTMPAVVNEVRQTDESLTMDA